MLFASGGLAEIRADYLERAQAAEEAEEPLTIDEGGVQTEPLPNEILDFLSLILDSYHPLNSPMPLFSGEQLKWLTMPVLYVAGLKDILLDSEAGEAALKESVPHAEICLLPNCGHVITNAYVWMLPFLAKCM